MYLRHTTIRKNGKSHCYWRLVRSVRCGGKVRQETVAFLGELDAQGRAKAKRLAHSVLGHPIQIDLFEPPVNEDVVQVRLRDMRLERGRRFGDVWVGWMLWRALGLEEWIAEAIPNGREKIAWSSMAAILVIARLCEPSSELHIAEDWYRKTSLDSLLGIPEEMVNEDRLYRVLDRLLPHKDSMEKHLKDRLGTLFALKHDLFLYDITSTYFEGEAAANPLAQYGYSRDHRGDCRQVCVALVVTREGIPLGHEIFAGNRSDVTTLEEIVETMEERYGRSDRIWVLDRGMISEDNLAFLKKEGRRYIVGTPRAWLKRFEREMIAQGWDTIREGLEVKRCLGSGGDETFILCRSQDRRQKEMAIHARFEKRIEAGLEKLAAQCEGRRCNPMDIATRVGRLLGANGRAAGLFDIDVKMRQDGGARIIWSKRESWRNWMAMSEGCYLLRSNVADWSAQDLWSAYIYLTEAEDAFRIQKSDLSIRPIWHQKEERVRAHILICFLAHVLYKTLQQWQSRAELGDSPRTILEEMRSIQSVDVVLPTTDGRTLRLRCVVKPDKAQQALLCRLGLIIPKRLKMPSLNPKM